MAWRRSPTETLVAAMERAEQAQECLVILVGSDGGIITLGTTNRLDTRLGMIELSKSLILKDIVSNEEA